MVSPSFTPSRSAAVSAWIAIARCEYTTPFGSPVVPLVKHIAAAERSSRSRYENALSSADAISSS